MCIRAEKGIRIKRKQGEINVNSSKNAKQYMYERLLGTSHKSHAQDGAGDDLTPRKLK